jgi:hypothetical protein
MAAANGVRLAAKLEAADLRRLNPARDPRQTRAAGGMYLARTGERDLLGRFAAFRVKVAKFGRMLPPREMLFPGLNRFPRFTILSAVHPLRVQGSGRTQRSPRRRALPAVRHSRVTEDFWVA